MNFRHKRRDLEHAEQATLFRWVRWRVQRRPELELLHAIPNGGDRHPAVAAKLKVEGVKRGVPDICLPVPRGPWHGLYIELKAGKNGASSEQRQWIAALREQGYRAELCRGWEAAARLIVELPARVRKITTTDEGKLQIVLEGEMVKNDDLDKIRDLLLIQQGEVSVDITTRQGELPV